MTEIRKFVSVKELKEYAEESQIPALVVWDLLIEIITQVGIDKLNTQELQFGFSLGTQLFDTWRSHLEDSPISNISFESVASTTRLFSNQLEINTLADGMPRKNAEKQLNLIIKGQSLDVIEQQISPPQRNIIQAARKALRPKS